MPAQQIVIIGGSSGMGLATARLLLSEGHKVTITGRNPERLAAASKSLHGDLHSFTMDATNHSDLPDAFARIGSCDHLVLALGSSKGLGEFATTPLRTCGQVSKKKSMRTSLALKQRFPTCAKMGA